MSDRVLVYDHLGYVRQELNPNNVFERVRTEELNGEHALSITTTAILNKGERLLTQNATGKWYEWVVLGVDDEHASGDRPIGTYYCAWSIQHDLSSTMCYAMPGTGGTPASATKALEAALSETKRWTAGTVDITTTSSGSMWRMSAWEALGVLVDNWGGEIDAEITCSNDGIVQRSVALKQHTGKTTATRRFDYTYDLVDIKRTIQDDPNCCRIIPLGAAQETENGGYGRKITIESVNDGADYLENPAVVDLYKLPDGAEGFEYPVRIVENGDISDPLKLKTWGESVLELYTTPQITYSANVVQLTQAGMDARGIQLGDEVEIVDRAFYSDKEYLASGDNWETFKANKWTYYRAKTWQNAANGIVGKTYGDGLRLHGRVVKMTINELADGDIQVEIGNISKTLSTYLKSLEKRTNQALELATVLNGGTTSTAEIISRWLERLNSDINATGGYTYILEGNGIRTYDKAVTDPLVGSEAGQVVEIKGGTIRIASSKNSAGEWEWKTVFVSGFVGTDLLTATNIVTGYLQSGDGSTYWNLDTGEWRNKHFWYDNEGVHVTTDDELYDAKTWEAMKAYTWESGRVQTWLDWVEARIKGTTKYGYNILLDGSAMKIRVAEDTLTLVDANGLYIYNGQGKLPVAAFGTVLLRGEDRSREYGAQIGRYTEANILMNESGVSIKKLFDEHILPQEVAFIGAESHFGLVANTHLYLSSTGVSICPANVNDTSTGGESYTTFTKDGVRIGQYSKPHLFQYGNVLSFNDAGANDLLSTETHSTFFVDATTPVVRIGRYDAPHLHISGTDFGFVPANYNFSTDTQKGLAYLYASANTLRLGQEGGAHVTVNDSTVYIYKTYESEGVTGATLCATIGAKAYNSMDGINVPTGMVHSNSALVDYVAQLNSSVFFGSSKYIIQDYGSGLEFAHGIVTYDQDGSATVGTTSTYGLTKLQLTANGPSLVLDNQMSGTLQVKSTFTIPWSGIITFANGGTGSSGLAHNTTVSQVITAASGTSISAVRYSVWGKVVSLSVTFTRTAAMAANATVTIGTVASGKRPTTQVGGGSNDLACGITAGGVIYARNVMGAQIAAATSKTIGFTYLLP